MSIPGLSVKKPVLITMMVFSFVVLGIYSYLDLSVDLFPEIDFPMVTVRTIYPGAGPVEIENLVSRPLEEEVAAINGVKNITSTSIEGASIILVEFQLETDIDVAAMDVKDKVTAKRGDLPVDIEDPIVLKLELGALPVLSLVISGERPLNEIYELADDQIKPELSKIPGLASIDIVGGKIREILVGVQRDRLQAYKLSIMNVVQSLIGENIELPSGRITEARKEYPIRVSGQFETVDEIKDVQLIDPDGNSPIRIRDVANVIDSFQEQREKVRYDKRNSVGLSLVKRPDANVVAVVNQVYKELDRIYQILPSDLEIHVVQDRAKFIKNSIADVLSNMGIGILLTAFILFLFLHNWQATVIAAVAMPTSIIATFLLIRFAGFTINMMTLTALAISVGILVTNSVIVIENIIRLKQAGEPADVAAERGTSEIVVAVAASTMTNIVVFTPIAFMSGIVGRFFLQFGLSVAFATVFSLIVSFTMVPMLASIMLKESEKNPNKTRLVSLIVLGGLAGLAVTAAVLYAGWSLIPFDAMAKVMISMVIAVGIVLLVLRSIFSIALETLSHLWWFRIFNGLFWTTIILAAALLLFLLLTFLFGMLYGTVISVVCYALIALNYRYNIFKGFENAWENTYHKFEEGYRNSLNWALDRRVFFLFIVGVFFFGSLYCFKFVGSEFFSSADQGMFMVTIEMPAGSSLEQTDRALGALEDILVDNPLVKYVYTEAGRQGGQFSMGAGEGVQLGQVTAELVGKDQRDISVSDFLAELRPKLAGIPGSTIHMMEISPGGGAGEADITVEVTGDDLDQLNILAQQVMDIARSTNGTTDIETSYRSGVPEIQIIPDRNKLVNYEIPVSQLAMTVRTSIEGNTDSKFRVGNKEYDIRIRFDEPYRSYAQQVRNIKLKTEDSYIPIQTVAEIRESEGPIQISRKNKKRMVTVTANTVNRSMGEIVTEMRTKISSSIDIPAGYSIFFGGQTEEMEESFAELNKALILSIVLTFMVLAAILGSFLHPVTIMITLPLAMIGVIMGLVMTGTTINILSMMAIVMLVGIVVNNAILQIDMIQLLLKEGKAIREATIEGCTIRLRPILMANMTTIFGMLPLALALGEGAEFRAPIGIVSIGGLITSTVFTLFVIPIIFTTFEKLKAKI